MYIAICLCLFHRGDFDVAICDIVPTPNLVFALFSKPVVFYCHFPDKLLAKTLRVSPTPGHDGVIRQIYRWILDFLEELSMSYAQVKDPPSPIFCPLPDFFSMSPPFLSALRFPFPTGYPREQSVHSFDGQTGLSVPQNQRKSNLSIGFPRQQHRSGEQPWARHQSRRPCHFVTQPIRTEEADRNNY